MLKPKWLLRRRAGVLLARADRDPSVANLEALERWCDEDPRHSSALNAGQSLLRQSARLPRSEVAARTASIAATTRSRPSRQLAVAASAAIALMSVTALYLAWQRTRQPFEAVLLATSLGEIRQVPLSDGSNLTLDTGTSVQIAIGRSRRQALVNHGRARFVIARTASPFMIRSGTTLVSVQQGVIDVSSYGADPQIELFSGQARIARQAKGRSDQLVVNAPASISMYKGAIHAVPGDKSSDWPSGRLSFAGARLADVIAAADRYTKVKIIAADPSIADLRVTGVFKAGDAEGLSRSLSAAFGLRVQRDRRHNIVLLAKQRQLQE